MKTFSKRSSFRAVRLGACPSRKGGFARYRRCAQSFRSSEYVSVLLALKIFACLDREPHSLVFWMDTNPGVFWGPSEPGERFFTTDGGTHSKTPEMQTGRRPSLHFWGFRVGSR
ncbi:MAG: hypothetical protein WAV08_07550, partial [Desulfobacterales bacterium]